MEMSLSVKNQSIETSGITRDYREAICEYIWNGFEANATEINISYKRNKLEGIDSICITDNGEGIDFNNLSETFGAFLASQKNTASLKLKSKANKGKGRFSFIAFSSNVEWETKYKDREGLKKYCIFLSDDKKETLQYTAPKTISTKEITGTTVVFYNIHDLKPADLDSEELLSFLLYEFAWYLYLNKEKGIKIVLNGTELDYRTHINEELSEKTTIKIGDISFIVNLIVWSEKIKEKYRCYYFDSKNSIKGIDTTTYNRNTVDFNHSVFVQSAFFDHWEFLSLFDASSQMTMFEDENDQTIFKKLKRGIRTLIEDKIKVFLSGKADSEILKMLNERKTFPIFTDDEYGELKKRDLISVTKELYCLEPRIFYRLKEVQEKSLLAFLNLILSSEERENILQIIDSIVQLTPNQRDQLANILQKTKLQNIIETISFIENRYRVIEILKTIIYDFNRFANERDHIQQIVENNYWLFGEQYHLASADQTMIHALANYNHILYGLKNATDPLPPEEDAIRRMDIFLCGARQAETTYGQFVEENIVVELKAPNVILSISVYRQIEDYMRYILKKPQFNSIHSRRL